MEQQNNIELLRIISACSGKKNKIAMQIVSDYITQQEAARGIPKTATLVDTLEKAQYRLYRGNLRLSTL